MVKKLRIPLGQRQQAEKGRGVGRCPMGYVPIGTKHNTRWEVSEPNATFVKELFAHYLSGSSLKKLPLMFAYVDKKGKKVHMSWQGILFLLQNKAYCGYINYKGELIKGTHTPLVSEQEFEKIQIELKRRKDL